MAVSRAFHEHVDYLSVQAVLMQQKIGIGGRIRAHLRYSSRSECPCAAATPLLPAPLTPAPPPVEL